MIRVYDGDTVKALEHDMEIQNDARSKATLQALADLSEKNQVILFTHHDQIVEEAKKITKGTVQIHQL